MSAEAAAVSQIEQALASGWRRWALLLPGDDEQLSRVARRADVRFNAGHALAAWDELEHARTFSAPPDVAAAVSLLAREDPEALTRMLSTCSDYLTVVGVAPRIDDEETFRNALPLLTGTYRAATLMLLRCLRWIASSSWIARTEVEATENLERATTSVSAIGAALAQRTRHEEVAMWWQAASLGPRLGGLMHDRFPPVVQALYGEAALRLAERQESDVLPDADHAREWRSTNDALFMVVPYVAHRLEGEHRRVLLDGFFADVDRRMAEEHPQLLEPSTPNERFYLEATGLAVMLDSLESSGPGWFEQTIGQLTDAASGWQATGRSEEVERPAWVLCAGAVGCLMAADMSKAELSTRLASRIADLADAHLTRWLARVREGSALRRLLPELMARTAALLSGVRRRGAILFAVSEAPDAATVTEIQRSVTGALEPGDLADVDRRRRELEEYELRLHGREEEP